MSAILVAALAQLAASAPAGKQQRNTSAVVSMLGGVYQRTVSYEGQQVLSCNMANASTAAVQRIHADFDVHGVRDTSVHVLAKTPAEREAIERLVGSPCGVHVADVEASVRDFESALAASRERGTWHSTYHTYDEIVRWYEDVADEFPLITKLVPSIGQTLEERHMPAFHITGSHNGEKKKIWFQCQIHAREWISGATCMYIVDFLTSNYGVVDEVTKLLDTVELVLIPFTNPDGYVYTWTNQRLWRKNRSPPPERSTCYGTDLNRNYRDHWGEGGSSTNPCSDTYMGSHAASELEVQHTTDYFRLNAPIYGGIDWHSFSQLILRPWGWTSADAPDERLLRQVGDEMAAVAEEVHRKVYKSQKSIALYPTTGTANDWFYGDDASKTNEGHRAYGFTVELRDTGVYGFELPPDQIIPQGQEMVPAAMRFIAFCVENPLTYKP